MYGLRPFWKNVKSRFATFWVLVIYIDVLSQFYLYHLTLKRLKYIGGGPARSEWRKPISRCKVDWLIIVDLLLDIKMKIVYAMLGVSAIAGSAGNLKNDWIECIRCIPKLFLSHQTHHHYSAKHNSTYYIITLHTTIVAFSRRSALPIIRRSTMAAYASPAEFAKNEIASNDVSILLA